MNPKLELTNIISQEATDLINLWLLYLVSLQGKSALSNQSLVIIKINVAVLLITRIDFLLITNY